jgi:DNA-binding transcriptional MerR regulator
MSNNQLIFESREIVKLIGVDERRLRYFADKNIVVPSIANAVGRPGIRRKYSLENIVDVYIANKLMDFGLTIPAIKRMLK